VYEADSLGVNCGQNRTGEKAAGCPFGERLEDALRSDFHINFAGRTPTGRADAHDAALLGFIGLHRHQYDQTQSAERL
jgi:hypothetical protein